MRLSDFLRMHAVTSDGTEIGKIDDVRVRVEVDEDRNAAEGRWFIDGFMVGRGALGNRLGYDGEHVEGPALLAKLMERLSRSARYVPLDRADIEGDRVVFRGERSDLSHPRDLREDPP